MPYEQLKKNANLRRFARIGKMESLLDWENAQSFYRDKTNYTIVQVENISNHQANPNFKTNRALLFIQKDGDRMEMNIIEVYKKKNDLNEIDVASSVKTFSENKIFNENKNIVGLNASILFYDQYYYNKSSFTVTNGIWEQASIIIENTSKRISSNSISNKTVLGTNVSNTNNLSLSTTSPMSGCVNCTEYFTVGIWYDKRTGKVVESVILDKWDECKEPDYPANGNVPGTSNLPKLPPSDKVTIKNNVLHKCISSTIDSIKNEINSFVQSVLNDNNDLMEFRFGDKYYVEPDAAAITHPQYIDPNGIFITEIDFNVDVLNKATQEFIASVALHEVLHGILLKKGVIFNEIIQHNEMATNHYYNLMLKTLNNLTIFYPLLTTYDAEALAWGGLLNTDAYQKLPEWKKRIIEDKLNRFRNGLSGTPCE